MKLYIFTQRDPVFIDQFLLNIDYTKFENVQILNSPNFGNSKFAAVKKFYKLFGFLATLSTIFKVLLNFKKLPEGVKIINDSFPNLQNRILTEDIQNEDILLSVSAPHKIDETILKKFDTKINFHCGKLPKYAGMMPVFWQMFNREKYYYISMHELDNEIDQGALLFEEEHPITKNLFKTMVDCKLQSARIFNELINGKLVCFRKEIKKTDSWNRYPTERQIENFRKVR